MDRVKFKGNIIGFSARAPSLDQDGQPRAQCVRTKFCILDPNDGAKLYLLARKPEAAREVVEALLGSGGKISLPPNEEAMKFILAGENDGEVQERKGFLRKLDLVVGEAVAGDTALTFETLYDAEVALWTLEHLGRKLRLEVEQLQGDLPLGERKPEDDPAFLRAAANLAPKPGSGIDRIEISAQGHEPVVLDQAAGKRLRARAAEARKQPKLNRMGTKNLTQRRRKGAPA